MVLKPRIREVVIESVPFPLKEVNGKTPQATGKHDTEN